MRVTHTTLPPPIFSAKIYRKQLKFGVQTPLGLIYKQYVSSYSKLGDTKFRLFSITFCSERMWGKTFLSDPHIKMIH
jgi:hypothetical protein